MDNQLRNVLENTTKAIGSIGGGILGTPADAATGPGGTIAGAALGNMAAQSLINLLEKKSPTNQLGQSAVQGAGQEMGGQVAGNLAGKLMEALKSPVPAISAKPPEVEDGVTYHGSNQIVDKPIAKSESGLFGPSFLTSPDKSVANTYAALRSELKGGNPVVNEYVTKAGGKELEITPETVKDLSDKLWISQAGKNSLAMGNNPEQSYVNMLKMAGMKQGLSPREMSDQLINALRQEGVTRIKAPIFLPGNNLSQIANLNPSEDLIYKPTYDTMNRNYQDSLENFNDVNNTNRVIGNGSQNVQTLLQALSRGQVNANDNQK